MVAIDGTISNVGRSGPPTTRARLRLKVKDKDGKTHIGFARVRACACMQQDVDWETGKNVKVKGSRDAG